MLPLLLLASTAFALDLKLLSGRPDMVTAGTALVEATGADGAIEATLNGADVSPSFRSGRARIEGLRLGKNLLVAKAGGRKATLQLVNHPAAGPVFSGPHQTPFVCKTEAVGLGPAQDGNCTVKTQVAYFYRSTEQAAPTPPRPGALPAGFKPWNPSGPRPSDLAETTTTEGKRVPHIVRREMGVINRAIYQITLLHEPGTALPDPWSEPSVWNGRLVYSFGGGCRAGYHQGLTGGWDAGTVGKGFAHAASSLNVFGNNCNDVISAETMMMVKEHFIKTFGPPRYTIGSGGSGGSMQQHLIAQNYPGLLDGITPSASYPDILSIVGPVTDCALLARGMQSVTPPLTDEQKTAVSGYATWKTCESWNKSFSPALITPGNCEGSVPKGTRCTLQDNQVNLLGKDPKTGFALRPLDNVGVQYGLAAFNAGKITFEQFLELNRKVGGFDADGNLIESRTTASPMSLRNAFKYGRINTGSGSLGSIPIIDFRTYVDKLGDIHDRVRTFSTRARLVRAHGSADNHVVLTNARGADRVDLMDQWLAAIRRDQAPGTTMEKIARNKPQGLSDACWDASGEKITEPASIDSTGRCNTLYPPHSDPRMAAGGPLTGDVLKCALKPVDPRDYKQKLSADQLSAVKSVFPHGVCDYTNPGVEFHRLAAEWRVYR